MRWAASMLRVVAAPLPIRSVTGFGEGLNGQCDQSYDKAERILKRRRRRVGFSLKKYLPGSGLYRQVGVFQNVMPSFWNTQDRLTKYTSP